MCISPLLGAVICSGFWQSLVLGSSGIYVVVSFGLWEKFHYRHPNYDGSAASQASGGCTKSHVALEDVNHLRIGDGVLLGCGGPLGLLIPFFASIAAVRL